jgi:TolB protein
MEPITVRAAAHCGMATRRSSGGMTMNRHIGFPLTVRLVLLPWAIAIGGCSMSMSIRPPQSQPQEEAEATPAPPQYLPHDLIDANNEQSKPVNPFGEFTRPGVQTVSLNPALHQRTFVNAGFDADVCVDADGKWMAFAGSRENGRTHLFRQAITSPLVVQLTDGPADEVQPCISRDGRRIAFSSNRGGRWHIYVMTADGRDITPLTDGDTDDMHPSFSPDGQRLVCCSKSEESGDDWKLVVVDITSGQRQTIGSGLFPSWSPQQNVDVIVFQKTRARGSRWFSIWTCQLTRGEDGAVEATNLTEIAASATSALVAPSWSPDGKSVTCSSISTGGSPIKQDVWIMASDGRDRRRLTDGANHNTSPCWSADGSIYFVSDRSGHECIWSMPTQDRPAMDKTAANEPAEIEP